MPRPPFRESLGAHPNEGARLLRLKLARSKLSSRRAGERLGVSSGLVSRWLFCDGKPGRALAARLHEVFGIKPATWDEPPRAPIVLDHATGTDG